MTTRGVPQKAEATRIAVHKRAFNIAIVLRRIRRAIRPLPKAAMFALAEEGYTSVFQQLIACILSIRTRDEVSLLAARRLFTAAPARRTWPDVPSKRSTASSPT